MYDKQDIRSAIDAFGELTSYIGDAEEDDIDVFTEDNYEVTICCSPGNYLHLESGRWMTIAGRRYFD